MAPILGYWNLRGRANSHRMLLHYAGVNYEEKQYDMNNFTEWMEKDKIQIKLDFPNLPYYIDEDVQLSQTHAILAYLGRIHDLDGRNAIEKTRMDLAVEEAREMFEGCHNIAYPPGNPFCGFTVDNFSELHEKQKKEYVAVLPTKLAGFSKFLENRKWVAGDRITYADFFVYEILDAQRLLFLPKHLNAFPNLVNYMTRFEGLKGVKEFLAKGEFPPLPIFSPMACFGQSAEYKATE